MATKTRILPDQFRHCSNLMRRMYHHNGPVNTRHGQGKLMHYLLEMDGATPKSLAKEMRMRPSSLNDVLRQAECGGFVTLSASDTDPRSVNVFLTEEGRMVAEKRAAANNAVASDIFAEFSDEEQAQFESLLGKLAGSLEEKCTAEDDGCRKHHHRSRHSRRYDGHGKCGGRRLRKNAQFATRV